MPNCRNFLIMPNTQKPDALEFTGALSEFLLKRGQNVFIMPEDLAYLPQNRYHVISADELDKIDVAIVLGGDGTVLRSVRKVVQCERDIPLLAVNFGRLGYLTECDVDEAFTCVESIIRGEYRIERRTLLAGSLIRNGVQKEQFIGVNEVVINRSAFAHPLSLSLDLNGNHISTFNADGIMAATPTGSTAYNLAAGGPLLTPCSNNFVITPICPISALQCSIVTPADDVIEIELNLPQLPPADDLNTANVVVDSILNYPMLPHDRVRLTRSHKTACFIKINDTSFYTALQKKLSVEH